MNIPMRWGRTATRWVMNIKNHGRYSGGGFCGGSPDWWQAICKWKAPPMLSRMRALD